MREREQIITFARTLFVMKSYDHYLIFDQYCNRYKNEIGR